MKNKDFAKKESNFFIENSNKKKNSLRKIKNYKKVKNVKKIDFIDKKSNSNTKILPSKKNNFVEDQNLITNEDIPNKSKKYPSKTIGTIKAIYKGMKAIDDELGRNETDQKESLESKVINSGDNFIYAKGKADSAFNFFGNKEELIDKSKKVSSEKFIFNDSKLTSKNTISNKKIKKKKFRSKKINKRKVGLNAKEMVKTTISGAKKLGANIVTKLKIILPKILIPILFLIVIISTFTLLMGSSTNNQSNNTNQTIPTTKNVEEFLEQYGDSFMYVANEYNLYASVMIAQAGIESAWGSSIIGNNLFGIKCYNREYGCSDNLTTNEEVDGKIITIKDSFQLSPEGGKIGAVKLYVDFLYNGSAFPKYSRKLTKTYHKTYKSAVNSLITDLKYATDTSYINKIINVIETYNLTKYDTKENRSYPELKNVVLNKNLNNDLSSMINKTGLPVNVSRKDIDKYITFHFGYRINPVHGGEDFHKGIDIVMPLNTPIYATHDGEVVHAHSSGTYNGGYGNAVFIKKGNIETRYAHLNSTVVREGQFVKKGTLIGYMGNTGQSSGAHLHYEYRINGDPIDPYKTFK